MSEGRDIFLLEDNESLGRSLEERLAQENYRVKWCKSLLEARNEFKKVIFDLAIIDVSLPDGTGFDFARELVQASGTPIVFLSAFSTAEYRLEGYDSGAADYIPKPFHLRELLLRIQKILSAGRPERLLQIGDCTLNLESRALTQPGQAPVYLPPRDFQLLKLLIDSAPRVVSRTEILDQVWAADHSGSSMRTVDNTIVRLRQLLGQEGKRILSVRGVGYQWIAASAI